MANGKNDLRRPDEGRQPVIHDAGRHFSQRGHQPKVTLPPKLNPPRVGSSATPASQASSKKH